jgi:acetylornithine deacetylase/succinyl-diaminopimelate desuccinylase-like protein
VRHQLLILWGHGIYPNEERAHASKIVWHLGEKRIDQSWMKPAALIIVAALLNTGTLGAQAPHKPIYAPGALTPTQQVARDIYKELIEINTSVTTGNITAGALAMAKRFRAAGVPDSDIFVGGPRPERQNVVARLRGKDPRGRKPILLLAHLDVVEALKADWSPEFDPFTFTERDGYYYGRGVADDKGMAAIFVANVFRMKAEGYVPARDVIIALTSDEESGQFNGVGWLMEQHPDLVDAGIVINEGGEGTLRDGKPIANFVELAQKVTANYMLRVTNRGGHSSVPRKDNAITSLADALGRIGRYQFPIQLSDVTRAFFSQTALVETPQMAEAMRSFVKNQRDSAALAVMTADPEYNTLLRTTCVATMLSGGHASNALPQLAEANMNCRLFPTDTAENIRVALERVIADTTVHVTIKSQRAAAPSTAMKPDIMQAIRRATTEVFGDIPVIPAMTSGGSDSRYFRAAGIPAYGVSGLFLDPATDARAHGRDERMRVQSYFEAQEFLYRLTKLLASSQR